MNRFQQTDLIELSARTPRFPVASPTPFIDFFLRSPGVVANPVSFADQAAAVGATDFAA